ncbi:MAG: hypothetical protein D0433_13960 [Candidatus Thermochlorobacter aerophilum]|jgi:uncharacterized membrane protein|uniref:DUF4149 domain-containing protein n=1 Tax=Candidatus Thermochlorobacter aerophilus TaxID=1868324 RepID=A0A395LW67_9BACT|nr:MAG: hypothetical protein D0433_13960 [Candidatus Thermochlorobacter aerophilum]
MRMNKQVFNGIFMFLEQLGSAVWVGGIIMFAVAVAGTVFREAGSINLAGHLNGKILARLNLIETAGAILMSISAVYFMLQPDTRDTTRIVKTVLLGLMVLLLIGYGKFITDQLEYLRTVEIKDFDNFDVSKQAFRDEFNRLHKLYTTLTSANLLMGISFIALSAFSKAKESILQ